MERIYTNYTAEGRQIVLNNVPPSFSTITVENIRLIFNESQKDAKGYAIDPLVSTGKKETVQSVTYNSNTETVTIILTDATPEILATDKLTIKIDMGNLESINIDTTELAKEETSQETLEGIGDLNTIIESINGDTVDNIVSLYLDDEAEQIKNIIGDWNNE